jgi:tetratricopeptide (TPR) repeat protein
MQADHITTEAMLEQLARTEGYLKADPENPHLLAATVDLALAAGALERAVEHSKAALLLFPDDAIFQYRWGQVLVAQRKWDEAAPLFATLLAAHHDLNLAYSLANCLFQLGRHQDAADALAGFSEQPDFPAEAATLLMRALHHAGGFDKAEALLAQHGERLAGAAPFQAAASLLLFDAGNVEQAAACSDAALAGAERPVEALVVNGSLALGRMDSGTAIERFNEVLARHPKEGRSWSGLGMTSLLRRDLAGAAVQLENAIKYMPGHIGTWHALGWCKLLGGDTAGAAGIFDSALALDRNFGESHGAVAVAAALSGRRAEAEAAIERALRLDSAGLSARYAQMVLSGQTSDPEKFQAIALRLLGGYATPFGESLAAVVARHADQ